MKALCPSWADTEIVSGVGDRMEDGAERKVVISSIVNVAVIILLIESPCSLVGWLVGWLFGWLVGWLVTKFQPHHTHMQHSQGLNITDVCIMHIYASLSRSICICIVHT